MRYMIIVAFTALASCGVAYHSTKVQDGVVDGAKVRVIEVTPETVLAANRQSYTPKSLPAFFRETTGIGPVNLPSSGFTPGTRPSDLTVKLPPALPNAPYRIGVGDVVLLATKAASTSVEQLSGLLAAENRRQGYTVQDDGSIAIPDVGRVRIAGMTIEEAEAAVFQELLQHQINPTFSLEIAEFNARKVSIGGAVVKPGTAPITLTPLTLDTAMADVGGISALDRDTAVIRIYRTGQTYQIPFTDYLQKPEYQKIRLADGDAVFVDAEYDPEQASSYLKDEVSVLQAGQTVLAQQRAGFDARVELGAEKRDYVYVSGEVGKPGRFPLPYEHQASLADALFEQGGVTRSTGNPRQVYILRGSDDAREFSALTAWHVDLGTTPGLMLATRMQLRPDDVVFVAEQPVTKWNRVFSQIMPNVLSSTVSDLRD